MNVLVITGERSAENYASFLIDELKKLGNFNFYSICSDLLENKTTKIADYRDISIIGAKEALPIIKKALILLKETKETIKNKNIELVVLLDFPDFNMKIAKFAKKLGKRVVYYITPQVWAWRKYRAKQLNKYTDLIIPILPFERIFFRLKKLKNTYYFGHPLVDVLHNKIGKHKKEKIILLMPGSRKSEILYNYKPIFEAARIIKNKLDDFRFVWVYPKHLPEDLSHNIKKEFKFIEVESDAHTLMDKSYFGILKSGTTTLEAAMFGLPMVVVYRMSPTSYNMGRLLIHNINYISLPNLISNEPIVKELIQDKATAENIASEFFRIHENTNLYEKMREKLRGIRNILGEYPVSAKIAKSIVSIL